MKNKLFSVLFEFDITTHENVTRRWNHLRFCWGQTWDHANKSLKGWADQAADTTALHLSFHAHLVSRETPSASFTFAQLCGKKSDLQWYFMWAYPPRLDKQCCAKKLGSPGKHSIK